MASMRSFLLPSVLALLLVASTSQVEAQQQCDAIKFLGDLSAFEELQIAVHRSGEVEPCGLVSLSTQGLQEALSAQKLCDIQDIDKYDVESFLTTYFAQNLKEKCDVTDFCDMGPDRTVIQPDHKRLKAVAETNTLPCRFYTREARHVSSLETLTSLALKAKQAMADACKEDEARQDETTCSAGPILHLTAVPAGRMFMFAPSFVGETFVVDHVSETEPIVVKVLSVEPRLFELVGFFSKDEAQTLISQALAETRESHKLKRSTTGAINGSIFTKRTSENAWLTHTNGALTIKRRCTSLLGMDEYWESHTDGLQLLRYQDGQAYVSHADYLDPQEGDSHDYDTQLVGSNRFATILLYMTDMGEKDGGETLFEKAWPVGMTKEQIDAWSMPDTVRQLRESGEIDVLKAGSWEERMMAMCRSRLAVRAKEGRAVLFYSQRPNGEEDKTVLHGACPVLNGTKWAANLWVWSGARPGFPNAAKIPEVKKEPEAPAHQKTAQFIYTGEDPRFDGAKVYYEEDVLFGTLSSDNPRVNVNTFEGHVWNIKKDGVTLKTFVIGKDKAQYFKV